jgi:Transcription factor WhiB
MGRSTEGAVTADAKTADCLAAAMDGREKIGIWGGLPPMERANLQRRERRACAVRETPAARVRRRADRPRGGLPSASRPPAFRRTWGRA